MTYASGERPEVGDVVRMIDATDTLMSVYVNRDGVVERLENDGKVTAMMRNGTHWGHYEPWRFNLLRRANLNAASEAGKAGG